MKRLFQIAFAVCLLWLPLILNGQSIDTIQLEQVVVSSDVKQDMEQSDRRRISSIPMNLASTDDIGRLLSRNSFIFLKSNSPGGLTTASFRGTGANHTTVLWNGFPLNATHHGQVDFSLLPVFLADEIEVSIGGTAANRADGLGGTVSLSNQSVFGGGLKLQLMQTAGSYANLGSFVDLSVSKKNWQLRTRAFRRAGKNDFVFLNTASWPEQRMKQKNADFLDRGFLQEVYFFKGQSKWSFQSWNQWNERLLPPIMTNMERGGHPKEEQTDFFSRNIIAYQLFWRSGSMEIASSLFHEKMHYFLQTTTELPPFEPVTQINSQNKTNSFMNSINIQQMLGEGHSLTFDVGLDNDWVDTENYSGLALRKSISSSLTSFNTIGKRIKTKAIVKHDWVDDIPVGLMPGFSLTFKPFINKDLQFTIGASRKYRLPGMNDLYWYPGGNPALKPEKAGIFDLTMFYRYRVASIDLSSSFSAYYSVIHDWIQWRPTSYRYWYPENIAEVHARGLEWHTDFSVKKSGFNIDFTMNHAYTLTTDESPVARFELTSGKQLIYIPHHHGNALLSIEKNDIRLFYQVEYTGSRYTNFSADDAHYSLLPSYMLHHIGLGTKVLNMIDLQLSVNNLLDKSYQAVIWRPMPGRHFQIRLMYQLSRKEVTND